MFLHGFSFRITLHKANFHRLTYFIATFASHCRLDYTLNKDAILNTSSPVRSTQAVLQPVTLRGLFSDYLSLTKPEITFLVTISALGGFLLGTPGAVEASTLLGLLVGVALSSSGGAALNLYMERDIDATMRRTDNRPLPAGRIKPVVALLFGLSCGAIGIGLLFFYTNLLTSALSLLSIVLYVLLYTP